MRSRLNCAATSAIMLSCARNSSEAPSLSSFPTLPPSSSCARGGPEAEVKKGPPGTGGFRQGFRLGSSRENPNFFRSFWVASKLDSCGGAAGFHDEDTALVPVIHPAVFEFVLQGLRGLLRKQRDWAIQWQRQNPDKMAAAREKARRARATAAELRQSAKLGGLAGQPREVVLFLLDGVIRVGGEDLAKNRGHAKNWYARNKARKAATSRMRAAAKQAQAAAQREAERPRPETWPPAVWYWFAGHVSATKDTAPVSPEVRRARAQKWRSENPDKHRQHKKGWRSRRRSQRRPRDLAERACRGRLADAMKLKKGYKSARTKELLGCSYEFLCAHLEAKFRDGMTWENYGTHWHIDHIKPCAKFDLTKAEEQRKCFHFSNLQPLLDWENLLKSDRYEEAHVAA